MYIDDLIIHTLRFLESDTNRLSRRDYLVGSFSITPRRLKEILTKIYPKYNYKLQIDFRDNNAKQWPGTIDYSQATKDWDFRPDYDEQNCIN